MFWMFLSALQNSLDPIQTAILPEPEEKHILASLPKLLLGISESPAKCAWITGFGGSLFLERFLFPSFKSLAAYLPFWVFIAAVNHFHLSSNITNLEIWNKLLIQIWLTGKIVSGSYNYSKKPEFNGWQFFLLAEYDKEEKPIIF